MYATKEQDYEKRKNQEGSYSLYNHLYNYLLNNYEPEQLRNSSRYAEDLLVKEGISYNIKGGKPTNEPDIRNTAKEAIQKFCTNNGAKGDTAHNLGKVHNSSFNNIKWTMSDLRW